MVYPLTPTVNLGSVPYLTLTGPRVIFHWSGRQKDGIKYINGEVYPSYITWVVGSYMVTDARAQLLGHLNLGAAVVKI